jgi:hypothetical protein
MLRLNITSLLAKNESGYATDPTPTGAANAILLKGKPTLTPMELTSVARDNLRPYFGNSEILPSSIFGKLDFEVEAAGSGIAGVAPAWGPLMRGCGWAETITAAAIVGTAQAGGSTTTIKLAAAASATDDLYDGMPISITAGTGNGQSGFIVDYDGTAKTATVVSSAWIAPDNTSQYSIGANVSYRPVSQNFESVALYMNIDGVLHRFLGARGNQSFSLGVDKIPSFKFSFQGLFQPVIDGAAPGVVLTGWKQPKVANKANTPFLSVHGFATSALESFDFDLANAIAHHALIGGTEQFIITDRKPAGNISMEAVTVATKDWWTIAQNATLGAFAIQHGIVAGNKVAITAPALQITNPKYGEKNGIAMLNAGLVPTPINGNDELAVVTF